MSVTIHTTCGDLKCEIFCSEVKRLSENFLAHCAAGTYDGTKFHRNQRGFVVQGGDPTGTGKGGESIWGGLLDYEFAPGCTHNRRGMIAMANRGPNSNGAQFYITYKKLPHLNNVVCVIGKVIHGFETLDAMERTPVKGKKFRPITDINIKGITFHANPFAT